jgi:NAD(P)-dependent dehydrogenase (short-subunit alcohol dehydrogenase family)
LNSPYAVAKAGVESLGRGLRGRAGAARATASVAYFGWVETRLVLDAFERPNSELLEGNMPAFLRKRIPPDEAAAALVRGVEERAPRIFAPKWWRYVSALRGILNPLLDRRFERNQGLIETVCKVEADADEQGAAAVSAISR